MPGPPGQGDPHDPPDKVESTERPIFLAGRAGSVAVVRHPFDLAPRFLLGRVIDYEHDTGLRRHPGGRLVDNPCPQVPPRLVQGPAQEDIETGEVFDARRPRQPQIGRDGLTFSTRQRPAAGQHRPGLCRADAQEALAQAHDKRPKG